ncbi:uncharacterized protein LOC123660528 [Melitaea cinxia]|uniref:uncharacterized protein LOC123660528 n=1 Tax=Melitaea cinxia TaxID=113334 RepID=UPI001E2732EF|nr:uncharacterized protein LOC123660528 [Melitaea cinxia]
MTSSANKTLSSIAKYRLSRRGKKLQLSDDQRTLIALPKDVPERTWAEILQKEENDLIIYDIREEILEEAMKICYKKYMEKQNVLFTAYCASEAWLKLVNWYFFPHDPGEDPSAYPPCYIPKRNESWIPDELPDPSPKDTWCKQELVVQEEIQDEVLRKWPSSSSIDISIVEDIPKKYWFPGKVHLPNELADVSEDTSKTISYDTESSSSAGNIGTESEVLENVTDYNVAEDSPKESLLGDLKTTTPVNGSLQGAGDSTVDKLKPKRKLTDKSKLFSKASLGRSKATLPPLDADSRSRISIISDCRLRNLRLETQCEITSEKIETPPGEMIKRK